MKKIPVLIDKKILDDTLKPMPWEGRAEKIEAKCLSFLNSPVKMLDLRKQLELKESDNDIAIDIVKRIFALILHTNRAEHQTWKMWEACDKNIATLELLETVMKNRFIHPPFNREAVSSILNSICIVGEYFDSVFVDTNYADVDYEIGSVFELNNTNYTLINVVDAFNNKLTCIPRHKKTMCTFEPKLSGLNSQTNWSTDGKIKYLNCVFNPEKPKEKKNKFSLIGFIKKHFK
jgi:hypothetical protein